MIVSTFLSMAQDVKKQIIPAQPFIKYSIDTGLVNCVFYLSESQSKKKLPLVVYIHGSGSSSLFAKRGERVVSQHGAGTWYDVANEKYRVLLIEKPGVNHLQQDRANEAFDKQFSLENWSKRIADCIQYVLRNEPVDSSRLLIAGHSEGGVVAASVASLLPHLASHVAILAGEGPSQLYSLYRLAEEETFFKNPNDQNAAGTDSLWKVWREIEKNPLATNQKFWGFTYLRWSSFLKTSVLDKLNDYNGKIYIVQGLEDRKVHPESAKILYVCLRSKFRNATLKLIPEANHSFSMKNEPQKDGWQMVIEEITHWFAQD